MKWEIVAFVFGNATGWYLATKYSGAVRSAKAALAVIETKATEIKKVF